MQCRLPQKIVTPEGPWITIVISGAARNSAVDNYVTEYSSKNGTNNTVHLGDKTIKIARSRLTRFGISVGSRYGYRLTVNGTVETESEGSGGSSMSSIFYPSIEGLVRKLTFSTITVTFEYTDYTTYRARANIVTS